MSATVNSEERQNTSGQAPADLFTNVVAPEVNIFETKDGYILEAEVPGVSKGGLEITVENTR